MAEIGKKLPNNAFSDVNEISLGNFILNPNAVLQKKKVDQPFAGPQDIIDNVDEKSNWDNFVNNTSDVIKKQLEDLKKSIAESNKPEGYLDQRGRAKAMANAVLRWASQKGYSGTKQVWWTLSPGKASEVLTKAVGKPVDSTKNPTDVLIRLGQDKKAIFLGVSAKSTEKKRGAITFRNTGLQEIDKDLQGTNLFASTNEERKTGLEKTPSAVRSSTTQFKEYIDKNPNEKEKILIVACKIILNVRDTVLQKLNEKYVTPKNYVAFRHYLIMEWLHGDPTMFPQCVLVTGRGENGVYVADIPSLLYEAPLVTDINMASDFKLEPQGTTSIGISGIVAGNLKRLFQIRFKWGKVPLYSSIAVLGDGWGNETFHDSYSLENLSDKDSETILKKWKITKDTIQKIA
jgi:hypothetical protein